MQSQTELDKKLDRLFGHPSFKKIEADLEKQDKLAAEIARVAAVLAKEEENGPKVIGEIKSRLDLAEGEGKKAQEEFDRVKNVFSKIQAELILKSNGIDRSIENHKAFLWKNSPKLRRKIEELKQKIEAGRHSIPDPPSPNTRGILMGKVFSGKTPLQAFKEQRKKWEQEISELTRRIYAAGELEEE